MTWIEKNRMRIQTSWKRLSSLIVACLCLAGAYPVHAAIKTEDVVLQAGSAAIKSSIKGEDTIDYRMEAEAGATLAVNLKTTNGANYFNVLREGADEALFIGEVNGTSFEGKLPAKGPYIIRVFLMRSAARRNEKADYTLTIRLSENSAQAASSGDFADGMSGGPDVWEVASNASVGDRVLRNEAKASGRGIMTLDPGAKLKNLGCRLEAETKWCEVELDEQPKLKGWIVGAALVESASDAAGSVALPLPSKFDASAQAKCSAGAPASFGLPPLDKTCEVRVIRRPGEVELWLLKPSTTSEGRFLSFSKRSFKSDDESEVTWLRSDDNWAVSVNGNEFYFFPDALLTGG